MPLKIIPLVTFQYVTSDPYAIHLLKALSYLVSKPVGEIVESKDKSLKNLYFYYFLLLKAPT